MPCSAFDNKMQYVLNTLVSKSFFMVVLEVHKVEYADYWREKSSELKQHEY